MVLAAMESDEGNSAGFIVRFVDGTQFTAADDSLGALVLEPIFLRYIFFCITIYGLLNTQPWQEVQLAVPELFALWIMIGVECLVWFTGAVLVLKLLWRRGMVKSVYTPLMVLPSLALFHATAYGYAAYAHGVFVPVTSVVAELTTDICVVLLLDLTYGQLVAPHHPSLTPVSPRRISAHAGFAMPEGSGSPPNRIAPVPNPTAAAATYPPPDATEKNETEEVPVQHLTVAGEKLLQSEIRLIRSEDHYLHIVTARQRVMLRGEISRVAEQMSEDLGFRVNRSVWLAFDQIEWLRQGAGGKLEIDVSGGDVVSVSKYRRVAFLGVYRRNLEQQGRELPWVDTA